MSAILNLINQAMLPADRHRIMTQAAREEYSKLRELLARVVYVRYLGSLHCPICHQPMGHKSDCELAPFLNEMP